MGKKHLDKKLYPQIIAAYKAGGKIKDIAKLYNIGNSTVSCIVVKTNPKLLRRPRIALDQRSSDEPYRSKLYFKRLGKEERPEAAAEPEHSEQIEPFNATMDKAFGLIRIAVEQYIRLAGKDLMEHNLELVKDCEELTKDNQELARKLTVAMTEVNKKNLEKRGWFENLQGAFTRTPTP